MLLPQPQATHCGPSFVRVRRPLRGSARVRERPSLRVGLAGWPRSGGRSPYLLVVIELVHFAAGNECALAAISPGHRGGERGEKCRRERSPGRIPELDAPYRVTLPGPSLPGF